MKIGALLFFVGCVVFLPSVCAGGQLGELVEACRRGDLEQVKSILSEGADVNAKTENGMTAVFFALEAGQKDVFEFLLSRGADINAKTTKAEDEEFDRVGQTMLHKAVLHDEYSMAEFLIEKGADIEARNVSGETPLYVAAKVGGVARGEGNGDVTGCEVEPNDLVAFSAPQVEIAEFGSQ